MLAFVIAAKVGSVKYSEPGGSNKNAQHKFRMFDL